MPATLVLTQVNVQLHLVLVPDPVEYAALAHLESETTNALNELTEALSVTDDDGFVFGEKPMFAVPVVDHVVDETNLYANIQTQLDRYSAARAKSWTLRVETPPIKRDLYYYKDETGKWCTSERCLAKYDANGRPLGRWIEMLTIDNTSLSVEIRLAVRHEMV